MSNNPRFIDTLAADMSAIDTKGDNTLQCEMVVDVHAFFMPNSFPQATPTKSLLPARKQHHPSVAFFGNYPIIGDG